MAESKKDINHELARGMFQRIWRFENNNVKAQKYDDKTMTNKIIEFLELIVQREKGANK